jgi:ribosome-binding ATPase YchF (GTP1/OBG family)
LQKKVRSGDKESIAQVEILNIVLKYLEEGKSARAALSEIDYEELKKLQLLTSKPILYVCNVLEDEASSGNSYS